MAMLGFTRFICHKMFALLEKWRFKLPNDITEEEMLAPHPVREFPDSHYLSHVTRQVIYISDIIMLQYNYILCI